MFRRWRLGVYRLPLRQSRFIPNDQRFIPNDQRRNRNYDVLTAYQHQLVFLRFDIEQ